MSYENLYNLTPRAFWNAVDGYWLDSENKDRKEWIRTRWQTCLLLNIHLPRAKQISANKLIKFEWETENENGKTDSYQDVKFMYDKMKKKQNIK